MEIVALLITISKIINSNDYVANSYIFDVVSNCNQLHLKSYPSNKDQS